LVVELLAPVVVGVVGAVVPVAVAPVDDPEALVLVAAAASLSVSLRIAIDCSSSLN